MVTEKSPQWEKDKNCKKCKNCTRSFTVFLRRHHCRSCGKVFCDECSSYRAVPESPSLVRVCNSCYFESRQNAAGFSALPLVDVGALKAQVAERLLALWNSPWREHSVERGVSVFVAPQLNSDILAGKVELYLNIPPERVYEAYNDMQLWRNWNKDLLDCRVLQQLDSGAQQVPNDTTSLLQLAAAEVMYCRMKVPVLDDRDVCLLVLKGNGTPLEDFPGCQYYTISTSMQHPACPEGSECVRAEVLANAALFEAVEIDGRIGTRFVSLSHVDPRGAIPAFAVNATISRWSLYFMGMKAFLSEHLK